MIDKKLTAVTQTTLNTLMTATNADLNLDSGLGQAHTCIRVKVVNEIITFPSTWILTIALPC